MTIAATILMTGCSSLDPTGLLADEEVSPRTADAGQSQDSGRYPRLSDVPEEPKERPSGQTEREEMRESLAADRANARYTDDTLRAPDAGADGERGVSAEAQSAPEAESGVGESGTGNGGLESRTPSAGVESEGGTAAGTGGMGEPQEMPEVPAAPSESAAGDSGAQQAGDRASQGDAAQGERDGQRAAATQTQQRRAETDAASADATGATTGNVRTASQASRTSSQDASGGGGAGRDNAAVRVNRSRIPQIQPSREGEPVRLPRQVRQRIERDGGASRQTAQLQTPPSAAGQVRAGEATTAGGERVAIVYFRHASASLQSRDRNVLRKVAGLYQKHNGGVRVVGHASRRTATMDMIAHRMANLDISMRRAEVVADALVSFGVPRGKIQVEAQSDRDPRYHEFMPTGEAGNRRSEIYLTRR